MRQEFRFAYRDLREVQGLLESLGASACLDRRADDFYVAVTGDNRVVAISVTTLDVVQSIATGRGPDGMAWAAAPARQ